MFRPDHRWAPPLGPRPDDRRWPYRAWWVQHAFQLAGRERRPAKAGGRPIADGLSHNTVPGSAALVTRLVRFTLSPYQSPLRS
jgi:hypothetical protein